MNILRSASVALALTLAFGTLGACGSDAASDGGSSGAAGSAGSGSAGKGNGGATNNETELTGTMSFSNGAKLDCKVSTHGLSYPSIAEPGEPARRERAARTREERAHGLDEQRVSQTIDDQTGSQPVLGGLLAHERERGLQQICMGLLERHVRERRHAR